MAVARQMLQKAVKILLSRVRSVSPEKAAELLQHLAGRSMFVPRLRRWLEENVAAFPEPFTSEDLDSMHDLGVDVLLVGSRSGGRVGFQVKSDRDLREEDFTRHLKAQILDAQRMGVELFVVVFACSPTQNVGRIKYWQTYSRTQPNPEILCVPPERAASLYEFFDHPIEPIKSGRTWADFFLSIEKPHLGSFYLDTWPELPPDQRFLPPEAFDSLRKSIEENRLTFLVGSPAAGKTFTAMQLLWTAFQQGRPVHWLTAHDVELTEGPIPTTEIGLLERTELKRRIDGLLKTLGTEPGRSPTDAIDIISRFLSRGSLVYIEDPFGKSEEEYDLSLASYDFFDLHRFVEELERSSKRADCRILVTSREPLFQRWLADLRTKGREAPRSSVIRLNHDDYYPGPLLDHAVLLGRARGLAETEAVAGVLVEHVDSPFEIDTLIRSLPPLAGAADAEEAVAGWKGDLRTKIQGRIAPRDNRDVIVLLLIAAADSQYESLRSPLGMYTKLHLAMSLEGEPKAMFDDSLKRLTPFLASKHHVESAQPFVPSHTLIGEVIREQLAAASHRTLLRGIARILPEIPPIAVPRRSTTGFFDIAQFIDPWGDHFLVALYLLSLGVALEGEEESEALDHLLFEQVRVERSEYRKMMGLWHLLPERLRNKIFDGLQRAPKEDTWGLLNAAASLPHVQIDPPDAWKVLELLLEEPQRGSEKTIYEESPWAYLFLHLEEVPQGLMEKLNVWAREDPASFVYAMDEQLLLNWDRAPDQWRRCLSQSAYSTRRHVRNRLIRTIARFWAKRRSRSGSSSNSTRGHRMYRRGLSWAPKLCSMLEGTLI